MYFGIVRSETQCRAIAGLRIDRPSKPHVEISEVLMKVRDLRLKPNCLAKTGLCFGEPIESYENCSEIAVSIRKVWC